MSHPGIAAMVKVFQGQVNSGEGPVLDAKSEDRELLNRFLDGKCEHTKKHKEALTKLIKSLREANHADRAVIRKFAGRVIPR